MAKPRFQRPNGTRDLYPDDVLRQRYITQAWRDVSIRAGFEEIAGPTFETLDLYTVKSGEGIVSELFSFTRTGGDTQYALRPEFTPTLARMYAAQGAQLPKPVRWFTAGPYFRAERPQRGRLREFLQWNCDVIGGGDTSSDEGNAALRSQEAEILSVLIALVASLGLTNRLIRFGLSDRAVLNNILLKAGVSNDRITDALALLDRRPKVKEGFDQQAMQIGLDVQKFDELINSQEVSSSGSVLHDYLDQIEASWIDVNYSIVRGLAYYTATVFEAIAQGERAVAGGGRYDNLIELFGGQPTPAVGFGMGDVVLSNLLDDNNLIPEGPDLADAVSRAPANARPDAFVIGPDEGGAEHVRPLLASLRRGVESERHKDRGNDARPWSVDRYTTPPLHARSSDKSTKNLKKLLADAERQRARFAVVVHEPDKVQLKDMDTREDIAHDTKGDFSINREAPNNVARAIAERLGYLDGAHQAAQA